MLRPCPDCLLIVYQWRVLRPCAAAYLVNDVYRKYIKPDATEKSYVRLSYVAGRVADNQHSTEDVESPPPLPRVYDKTSESMKDFKRFQYVLLICDWSRGRI